MADTPSVVTVCPKSVFPSFPDFALDLSGLKLNMNLPSLPTLPSPLFGNLHMPDLHVPMLGMSLMYQQLIDVISMMLNKLMSFVPAIPFPRVPVLDISLPEIPSINWAALIAKFRFDLPSLPSIPTLPDPLIGSIKMPDIEVVAKIQALLENYLLALVGMITSLCSSVLSKLAALKIPGLPVLPTLPTLEMNFDFLIAPIMLAFGVPNFAALIAKLKLPNISMPSISIPGFPSFAIPNYFLGLKMPELNLVFIMKNLWMSLCQFLVSMLADFMKLLPSPFPSFTLPTTCIPVPVVPDQSVQA